jgi:hypothetical protein
MDPYLEPYWGDVHARLAVYASDVLRKILPSSLRARIELRTTRLTPEGIIVGVPDVEVTELRPDTYRTTEPSSLTAAAPLILDAEPPTTAEKFIEIRDVASGNKLVTQIEFLSPANKLPGKGREEYEGKQRDLCETDVNLVEIDLVRAGRHVAAVALEHIPLARRTPYLVCVRRATNRGKAEVYPIPLSGPLPAIKIPLRPSDADVVLALQPLIDRCSECFEGDLDYTKPPVPPLTGPDAEWADHLLREKGLRTTPDAPAKSRRKKPQRRKGGE